MAETPPTSEDSSSQTFYGTCVAALLQSGSYQPARGASSEADAHRLTGETKSTGSFEVNDYLSLYTLGFPSSGTLNEKRARQTGLLNQGRAIISIAVEHPGEFESYTILDPSNIDPESQQLLILLSSIPPDLPPGQPVVMGRRAVPNDPTMPLEDLKKLMAKAYEHIPDPFGNSQLNEIYTELSTH